MRFFGLKSCDTCRKALKALAGQSIDVIDVRHDGVNTADLDAMFDALGIALVNTRSTTWRGLSEAERAMDPKMLLKQYSTLMKRPVMEIDGAWYVGWTPQTRTAAGVSQ